MYHVFPHLFTMTKDCFGDIRWTDGLVWPSLALCSCLLRQKDLPVSDTKEAAFKREHFAEMTGSVNGCCARSCVGEHLIPGSLGGFHLLPQGVVGED